VFLNNRYYDPTTGTFLSVDPLVAKTGQAYLYAAGNPTTLSDPSGLCSVGGAGFGEEAYSEALNHCVAARSYDEGTKAGRLQGDSKIATRLAMLWARELFRGRREVIALTKAATKPDGGLGENLYNSEGPEGLERRMVTNAVDRFLDAGAAEFPELFPSRDRGWFDGCNWKCAVATITTGLLAGGSAGAVCVFTLALGCAAATTAAIGTTSVVYESTSNPDASGGDLVCAFFFGPSNDAANVVSIVASGGLTAATQGAKEVVTGVAKDVLVDQAGGVVCR